LMSDWPSKEIRTGRFVFLADAATGRKVTDILAPKNWRRE
jgi:hypothetical protein